jgi:thioredoxin 1
MNGNENKPLTTTVGGASFEAEVLQSETPVLAAFLTRWSRACEVLSPILDEVATAGAGQVKVVTVDADDQLDLSVSFEIRSIPTMIHFVNGRECFRIVGTASKAAILAKLNLSAEPPAGCPPTQ